MAMPNVDELNTVTQWNIMPGLADLFFKNGIVLSYIKEKRMKTFEGGIGIQESLLWKPLKPVAYAQGMSFDLTKYPTKAALRFTMKKYAVPVVEYLEETEIEMRSPHAIIDSVKVDLANAAMSISAMLEIDIMQHGQNLAGGADRSLRLNGFEEALNDGTNASWAGNTFTAYGQQQRADIAPALNPAGGTWAGGQAPVVPANINGAITNRVLEHSYSSCIIGKEHPVAGITTNRGLAYILEKYAPMQRLADTVEPTIGWPGVKFKGATIMASQYMPGRDGIDDPLLGNYYASGGETFLWLNPGPDGDECYFRLHTAASPKFQFGFTGFKVAQDNTMLAGQILYGGNFAVRVARLMRMHHGITS